MAEQIPKHRHLCCTCDKWAGRRKLDFNRIYVEIESATDQGECIGGPRDQTQTFADYEGCDGWSIWWQIR
jgi:hypothetical protein